MILINGFSPFSTRKTNCSAYNTTRETNNSKRNLQLSQLHHQLAQAHQIVHLCCCCYCRRSCCCLHRHAAQKKVRSFIRGKRNAASSKMITQDWTLKKHFLCLFSSESWYINMEIRASSTFNGNNIIYMSSSLEKEIPLFYK